MPLAAQGAKSKISWVEESAYAVSPAGVLYNGCSLVSETFQEQINSVKSAEIRPDRTVPSIRGGNIGTAGVINNELAATDELVTWLIHLMASLAVYTSPALDPSTYGNIAGSTAYIRGTFLDSDGLLWVCTTDGTSASSPSSPPFAAALISSVSEQFSGTAGFSVFGPTSGAYSIDYHIPGGIVLPVGGLTFEKSIKGQTTAMYILFNGCRLDSLSINIQQEALTTCAWNIIGLQSTVNTAPTPSKITYPQKFAFAGQDAAFYLNGSYLAVKAVTLDIKNNYDAACYTIFDRYHVDVPEGRREISGTFEVYFENRSAYDAFKLETTNDVVVDFIIPGNSINGAFESYGSRLQIEMYEVKLTGSGTPQISGSGVISETYTMEAFHQNGASDLNFHVQVMSPLVAPILSNGTLNDLGVNPSVDFSYAFSGRRLSGNLVFQVKHTATDDITILQDWTTVDPYLTTFQSSGTANSGQISSSTNGFIYVRSFWNSNGESGFSGPISNSLRLAVATYIQNLLP